MIKVEKIGKGTYFGDAYKVSFRYDVATLNKVKSLAERRYLPEEKAWEIPAYELPALTKLFVGEIETDDKIMDALKEKEAADKRGATQERLKGIKPAIPFEFKTAPLPHQIEAFNVGLKQNSLLIGDQQGLGKAVTLDTKVITPYGFKYMRDIHVGDYVIGANGELTKVIAEYPQGEKEIFKVTFSDGSTVDCCKEHLWGVFTNNDRQRNKEGLRVLSLDEIMQSYKTKYNYKYYIPMTAPVKFISRNVKVPPYTLGVLLGDGYLENSCVSITTNDAEIIELMNCELGVNYFRKVTSVDNRYDCILPNSTLGKNLKEYGLIGCRSEAKFIPEDYLYNEVDVRVDVLSGLLDTDGYIMDCGTYQYYTVSDRLCEGVTFLVNSLGGTVKHHIKQGKYKKNGKTINCKECHVLTISLPNEIIPFKLSRRLEKYKPRQKYYPIRMITNIEYVGMKEAKCITVNNYEGLYLVNDFVVTHNTKESIDITVARKKEIYKCLIVCGVNSVKYNWEAEIKTHSEEGCTIFDDRTMEKRVQHLNSWYKSDEFFGIINIESIRNEKVQDAIHIGIRDKYIGAIIVDEIHKAKNGRSRQGKALRMLKAPIKIGLTGTPIMSKAEDLWNILTWLGVEHRNVWQFRNSYCVMGGYGGYTVVDYKNLESLNGLLNTVMLRRTKADVLDLPPKVHQTEYVELTRRQRLLYRDIRDGIIQDLEDILTSVNPLTSTLRLRQLTGGLFTDDNPKLDRIKDMLEEEIIPNGEKAIIFSQWKEVTAIYKEALSAYNPIYITGDVDPAERQREVNRFQTDPECKVAIGTIGAMGTGLTLNKAAYVFFVDKAWTSGENEQAEDRSHRIGTAGTVTIISMVAKNSIDEGVEDYLKENRDLFDKVVDGKGQKTDMRALLNNLLKL